MESNEVTTSTALLRPLGKCQETFSDVLPSKASILLKINLIQQEL